MPCSPTFRSEPGASIGASPAGSFAQTPSRPRRCVALALTVIGVFPVPGYAFDVDFGLDAATLERQCAEQAGITRQHIAALLDTSAATPDAAMRLVAVEQAAADLLDALIAHRLLADTGSPQAVAAASGRCKNIVASFRTELAGEPAIAGLAAQTLASAKRPDVRALAQRFLERGGRAGADRDAATRARMTALANELAAVQIAFRQALNDDETTVRLTDAEASTLPPEVVSTARRDGDRLVVPVSFSPLHDRILQTLRPSAARRRYLKAFLTRGGRANLDRLTRAVDLRRQLATLHGASSWASFRLAETMARTPDRAFALIEAVSTGLARKARDELAALAALKRADGDDEPFGLWDYRFYRAVRERTAFGVDSDDLRDYFPVDHVVGAVLAEYERLFGLDIQERPGTGLWHDTVRRFDIRDAGSEHLRAIFLLDIVPRAGKFHRPATFGLRAARRLPDGSRQVPVVAIIGNGPPALPERPATFGHRDLVEFFHEVGHVMHAALDEAPYPSIGADAVRRDFVELPSQALEQWAWDPAVLERVSRHVRTGRPLPAETLRTLHVIERDGAGLFWTRQAFLAAFDLELHAARDAVDPNELWFSIRPRITPLPALPGTMPPASFLPAMGGYDSTYYGYLWTRVYAQDVFAAFVARGLGDPGTGRRFRETVLAPGASVAPDVLLERFLGRAPTAAAFNAALGVAPQDGD